MLEGRERHCERKTNVSTGLKRPEIHIRVSHACTAMDLHALWHLETQLRVHFVAESEFERWEYESPYFCSQSADVASKTSIKMGSSSSLCPNPPLWSMMSPQAAIQSR
jgi:hypothetical protein